MPNIISLIAAIAVVLVVGNCIDSPKPFTWTLNIVAGVMILSGVLEARKCHRKK